MYIAIHLSFRRKSDNPALLEIYWKERIIMYIYFKIQIQEIFCHQTTHHPISRTDHNTHHCNIRSQSIFLLVNPIRHFFKNYANFSICCKNDSLSEGLSSNFIFKEGSNFSNRWKLYQEEEIFGQRHYKFLRKSKATANLKSDFLRLIKIANPLLSNFESIEIFPLEIKTSEEKNLEKNFSFFFRKLTRKNFSQKFSFEKKIKVIFAEGIFREKTKIGHNGEKWPQIRKTRLFPSSGEFSLSTKNLSF